MTNKPSASTDVQLTGPTPGGLRALETMLRPIEADRMYRVTHISLELSSPLSSITPDVLSSDQSELALVLRRFLGRIDYLGDIYALGDTHICAIPSQQYVPGVVIHLLVKAIGLELNDVWRSDTSALSGIDWQDSDITLLSKEEERSIIEHVLNEEDSSTKPVISGHIGVRLQGVQGAELARKDLVEQTLGRIATTSQQINSLNAELDEQVASARTVGISWRKIATAVGITGAAAHRRWNVEANRKHAAYQKQRRQRAQSPNQEGGATPER